MKISKLFHWLYATLMFLPLFVIPVFAIYSHRHDVAQDFELVEQQPVYYESNVVNSVDDLYIDYIYYYENDITLSTNDTSFGIELEPKLINLQLPDYEPNSITGATLYVTNNAVGLHLYFEESDTYININSRPLFIVPLSYYAKNHIPPELLAKIKYTDYKYIKEYQEVVTTIPKDVMTSFMDRLINVTDSYLNFDNVLNLKLINEWINTNVFNGNAPLVWTIIWHYLDYWLLLSIFWLCFDVLIYVPQLAHRWLDKASLE